MATVETRYQRRTRVFLSYSRKDDVWADWLSVELKRAGIEVFRDLDDTLPGEVWWVRLEELIGKADTVVFMLSPNSVASSVCRKEVAHAQRIEKRIFPVMIAETDWRLVPEGIGERQCLFLEERATRERRIEELVGAIASDIGWIREHTRLGELARHWDAHNRPAEELLWSASLAAAETWLVSRPASAPAITELQATYIQESRAAFDREEAEERASTGRYLSIRSRFLATLADRETSNGSPATGMLLALEGLEGEGALEDYRYVPEAVRSVYAGLRANHEFAVLGGHGDELRTAVFSPDGERVLTTSSDGTARVWNGVTGEAIAVLELEAASIESAAYSPDGHRIVAALSNGTVCVFDALTGHAQITLSGHPAGLVSASFSADGERIVSASEDGTARLWDVKSAGQLAVLAGHSAALTAAAFSPDGRWVITASDDKTARIWDGRDGRQIRTLAGHEDKLTSAGFDSGATRALTSSRDGSVRVWHCPDGRELAVLRGHEQAVYAASFSPDDKLILTAGADASARLWDAQSYGQRAVLSGHGREVVTAVFSADGRKVVTASHDRTARIWDTDTARPVAVLRGHESSLWAAAFSPDGERVVTAAGQSHYETLDTLDNTARLWRARIPDEAQRLAISCTNALVFSPDGRTFCAASHFAFDLWDVERGQGMSLIPTADDARDDPPQVVSAAFSPDGERVIAVQEDGIARLFEVGSGRQTGALETDGPVLLDAVFSPDGYRLLTPADDHTARIWDARSGAQIATLGGHQGRLNSAAFSPDGRRIVTASADETVRLWDAEEARELSVIQAHKGNVRAAAFSPDGRKLLTRWGDTAGVWDAASGRALFFLGGPALPVLSAAFSPDGKRILTRHRCDHPEEGAVRLWNAETGAQVWAVKGYWELVCNPVCTADGKRVLVAEHVSLHLLDAGSGTVLMSLPVSSKDALGLAAISPDGVHVVAAPEWGNMWLWRVIPSTEELIEVAKGALPRGLTHTMRDSVPLDPDPPDWYVEMGKWPYDTHEWKRWLADKRTRRAARPKME